MEDLPVGVTLELRPGDEKSQVSKGAEQAS